MKIYFLGTGTSTGNPEIGCRCEVCTSANPKDFRFRTSALFKIDGKHILIDCGPDFRMQMLALLKNKNFFRLDGVVLTHEHYDHVGGLEDLRPFCKTEPVDIYGENNVVDAIRGRMPYAFADNKLPGIPNLRLNAIGDNPFAVEGVEITPIRLMHARLPIYGYRIGNVAYLTDLKTIPDEEYEKLRDLDVLIMNALRPQDHFSHQSISEALKQVERIRPKKTYFIHMSHTFGLHEKVQAELPDNVFVAHDGLVITV